MIINLNKPIGWTSFDVCKKIKRITKEKKVGHAGTLDPFASGVLIIGTGKDTKKLKNISDKNKSYDASILLGEITDTLDVEGKVFQKKKVPINHAIPPQKISRRKKITIHTVSLETSTSTTGTAESPLGISRFGNILSFLFPIVSKPFHLISVIFVSIT